jgi:hypothetical protein
MLQKRTAKESTMAEAIRTQQYCYFSTPQHVRSFTGMFINIYKDRGSLRLTSDSLSFSGKKRSFEIPLHTITKIGGGHYSRIAKPIRLDYISVTYSQGGIEDTVLLTPTVSWVTPVWKTNEIVADWKAFLEIHVRR